MVRSFFHHKKGYRYFFYLLNRCIRPGSITISRSKRRASTAVSGTLIPYFRPFFFLLSISQVIWSRFCKVYDVQHLNVFSSINLLDSTHSAVITGLNSFRSFKGIHYSIPSFHWTLRYHPLVVNLVLLLESAIHIANSSLLWFMTVSRRVIVFPSWCTWLYISQLYY